MNQGAKVEWKVKLEGEKPMTVNWFKDGVTMKASRNVKLNYIARTGEVGRTRHCSPRNDVILTCFLNCVGEVLDSGECGE